MSEKLQNVIMFKELIEPLFYQNCGFLNNINITVNGILNYSKNESVKIENYIKDFQNIDKKFKHSQLNSKIEIELKSEKKYNLNSFSSLTHSKIYKGVENIFISNYDMYFRTNVYQYLNNEIFITKNNFDLYIPNSNNSHILEKYYITNKQMIDDTEKEKLTNFFTCINKYENNQMCYNILKIN